MKNKNLFGLILCGGKSSRMGIDKSLIAYHGKPQREYLTDLLQNFCQEVHLSCKEATGIPENLNPLVDAYDVDSPLNGILSAIRFNPKAIWLTVPVDMPGINHEIVDYLISKRDPTFDATCFVDSDGTNPEPLLCIWETRSFSALSQYFESGNISPRKFLQQCNVKLLNSPFAHLYHNINSEADLNQYKKDISGK